mmetsp:Transcript_127/g.158  ORF Transcript_127/g.158 Transcript_127/m.158 type:complete len:201 (+) Transcript_127:724-1326(+)
MPCVRLLLKRRLFKSSGRLLCVFSTDAVGMATDAVGTLVGLQTTPDTGTAFNASPCASCFTCAVPKTGLPRSSWTVDTLVGKCSLSICSSNVDSKICPDMIRPYLSLALFALFSSLPSSTIDLRIESREFLKSSARYDRSPPGDMAFFMIFLCCRGLSADSKESGVCGSQPLGLAASGRTFFPFEPIPVFVFGTLMLRDL